MQHKGTGMKEMVENSPSLALDELEQWTLERRWYDGQLLRHVDVLTRFAEKHRGRILALAASRTSRESLLNAMKAQIVQTGTLDAPAELRDQAREIKDEIWYRGEKGDFDRQKIQLEWTERHAAAWRLWRLKEYLFVVDRCGHQLVRALQAEATGTGR